MKSKIKTVLKYWQASGSIYEAENVELIDGTPVITWSAPRGGVEVENVDVDDVLKAVEKKMNADFFGASPMAKRTRASRLAMESFFAKRAKRLELETEEKARQEKAKRINQEEINKRRRERNQKGSA